MCSTRALRGSGRWRMPPLRTELQKPTLPELLRSRCRGRLFDTNPEEREACGGLPPPRQCVSLARSLVCLRFLRTGISGADRMDKAYGFHAPSPTQAYEACGNCLRRLNRRSTGPERAKWQHWCSRRPNALTLSCKNRLPRLPREAARRLPRLTRSGESELQPA